MLLTLMRLILRITHHMTIWIGGEWWLHLTWGMSACLDIYVFYLAWSKLFMSFYLLLPVAKMCWIHHGKNGFEGTHGPNDLCQVQSIPHQGCALVLDVPIYMLSLAITLFTSPSGKWSLLFAGVSSACCKKKFFGRKLWYTS